MPDQDTAFAGRRGPVCPLCKRLETARSLPTSPLVLGIEYWQCGECGAIWATKNGERVKDAWRDES